MLMVSFPVAMLGLPYSNEWDTLIGFVLSIESFHQILLSFDHLNTFVYQILDIPIHEFPVNNRAVGRPSEVNHPASTND